MNIWKKQGNNLTTIQEIKLDLMYCMNLNIYSFNSLLQNDKKSKFKNYWLQKKEDKERDNKLEKIAECVTKYIKAQTKG